MVALSDQLIKTHGLYTSFIQEPIMRTVTASGAKQGLAQVIETAAHEPVVIQRQKRDVAVVLSMHKTMTLSADEFMRRFLLHGLPNGFHRIRHYGLLANAGRRENLAKARHALHAPPPEPVSEKTDETPLPTFVCRCCGAAMRVVEVFFPCRPPIRAPP
jgi:hypothetical protein